MVRRQLSTAPQPPARPGILHLRPSLFPAPPLARCSALLSSLPPMLRANSRPYR